MALTAAGALVWVAKLASVPMILGDLEYLHTHRSLQDKGLMSWEVGRLRHRFLCSGPTAGLLNAILAFPNVLWLLRTRLLLGLAVLLSPPSLTLHPLLIVPLAICEGLGVIRTSYGLDGSDQMCWLTLASLAIASALPTPSVQA